MRIPTIGRAAAALAILLALAACAAPRAPAPPPPPREEPAPEAPPEPPGEPPSIAVTLGAPRYLDQRRLTLPVKVTIRNPGASALSAASPELLLSVGGGGPLAALPAAPPADVPAGGERSFDAEPRLDLGELCPALLAPGGPSRAAFRAEARAELSGPGGPRTVSASADGFLPIVRPPVFRITSIRIARDVLVTTRLRIGFVIENPNEFPLELGSMSYRLAAEGKPWAEGERREAANVPALGSSELGAFGTMNFADMDRRLFDLVATLRSVRYRVAGEARVLTPLEFLPAFTAAFDLAGDCAIER